MTGFHYSQSDMRKRAIRLAEKKWKDAPSHVKLIASAYVNPIFLALEALGQELDSLHSEIEKLKGG